MEQQFQRFHRSVTRMLLIYFNLFGQVSLNKHTVPTEDELLTLISVEANPNQVSPSEANGTENGPRRKAVQVGGDLEQPRNDKYPEWLSNICLAIYLYISFKMMINVFFQYRYDSYAIRLRRIDEMLLSTVENATVSMFIAGFSFNSSLLSDDDRARLASLKVELLGSASFWRRALKWIGAPHINCYIIVECATVLLMLITHLVYINGRIAEARRHFDMYFVRSILNPRLELLRCRRMIEGEARKILESSANSTRALVQRVQDCERLMRCRAVEGRKFASPATTRPSRNANHQWRRRADSPSLSWNSCHNSTGCDLSISLDDHENLKLLMQRLVQDDQLVPANRSDKWIDSMSLQFSAFSTINLIYSTILNITLVIILPIYTNQKLELTNLMDKVALCELLFFTFLSINSTVFFLALLSVNATNQARYMKRVQASFLHCSHRNSARVQQMVLERRQSLSSSDLNLRSTPLDPSNQQPSNKQLDQMNANLAKSLLEYRIFLTQFKAIQKSFSLITVALYLLLFIPLMIRLHISYYYQDFWWFGVYFSISALILTDSISVPICIIHNQGQRLYKVMSHMLAQAIELNIQSSGGRNKSTRRVYNEHLVWLLRRIVDDPKRFTDQFASQAFPGILLTFSSLTEIHYLFSLVLLSAFVQIESWQRLFGSRLNDPFGLFEDLAPARLVDGQSATSIIAR